MCKASLTEGLLKYEHRRHFSPSCSCYISESGSGAADLRTRSFSNATDCHRRISFPSAHAVRVLQSSSVVRGHLQRDDLPPFDGPLARAEVRNKHHYSKSGCVHTNQCAHNVHRSFCSVRNNGSLLGSLYLAARRSSSVWLITTRTVTHNSHANDRQTSLVKRQPTIKHLTSV